MKCLRCGFENLEGMKFCGRCGASLTLSCPKCGYQNPMGFRFCGQCGLRLGEWDKIPPYARRSPLDYTPKFLVKRVLDARTSLEGERKLVTVLFADVADFVGIAERLDPEDVHQIMDGCFEILGQEIHGAGGTINQYTGDGVMALFGAPIAYDDNVRPACRAGLEIQRRIELYGRKIAARFGISFKIRIGMHTGLVVIGAIGDNLRLDYTAMGDTTNVAERLQSLAKPGQILVSERVRRDAGEGFVFRDMGRLPIKGRTERLRTFLLVGERHIASAPEKEKSLVVPFIDRQKELRLLKACFEESVEEGPELVAVTGEAGIGKASLIQEFHRSLKDRPFFFLEGSCSPWVKMYVAFHPLAQMLRSYFNLSDHHSVEEALSKIKSSLKNTSVYPRLEHLARLYREISARERASDVKVQGRKRELFRGVRDLLIHLSSLRPVIMVLYNMQWVDPSTREFLSYLLRFPERVGILLICLGRSDPNEWVPGVPNHLIRLKPLTDEHALALFSSVLGTERLAPGIAEEILSNADGNPLFLVETAQTLRRQELLICGSVQCRLALPARNLPPPDRVHEVLAAHLDALPVQLKRVVQLASVIGREFSCDLLKPLLEKHEDLSESLDALEEEGILKRISSEGGNRYRFRQQMMREVAYQSLLREKKKAYHEIIGKTLETLCREDLRPHMGILAYHFYEAEDWAKALAYSLEAGKQARASYACQEALSLFDRALSIISRAAMREKQETLLQLYEWKGAMHYCLGQMEKAQRSFEVMLMEAERLRHRQAEAEALFRIGWISFYRHQPKRAQDSLAKSIRLSKEEGLKGNLSKASSFLGFVYMVLGKLEEARPFLMRALHLSGNLKDREGRAWSIAYLLQYYNWIGKFDEALRLSEELKTLNREIKNSYFEIFRRFAGGMIYGALGRTKEARKTLEEGLKRLETGVDRFWRTRFLNTLGWVCAEEGKIGEALKWNQEALKTAMDSGDPETIHNARINVGENYLLMGNLPEAQKILEETWHEVKKPGVFYTRWRYKTRLLIALAELYGRQGDRGKGLSFCRRALRLAGESEAKKHQARALLVRGMLLAKTRPNFARSSLERALTLSKEMGTRLLSERIHKALEENTAYE